MRLLGHFNLFAQFLKFILKQDWHWLFQQGSLGCKFSSLAMLGDVILELFKSILKLLPIMHLFHFFLLVRFRPDIFRLDEVGLDSRVGPECECAAKGLQVRLEIRLVGKTYVDFLFRIAVSGGCTGILQRWVWLR